MSFPRLWNRQKCQKKLALFCRKQKTAADFVCPSGASPCFPGAGFQSKEIKVTRIIAQAKEENKESPTAQSMLFDLY